MKLYQVDSALNNFDEYTMLTSSPITQYYGFTEEEVKDLCEKYDMDFETTKAWYNGYLAYDAPMLSAYIPNYEVAKAFQMALKTGSWKEIAKSVSICDELLMATITGKEERVAELIELAHETYTSVLTYNDENSLN